MEFQLLEDRIAVLADEAEEKTASGIYVPETGRDVLRYGTVKVIGNGHRSDFSGEFIPIDLAVGDRIFFGRGSGMPLKIDDVEYIILSPREIVGRIIESTLQKDK